MLTMEHHDWIVEVMVNEYQCCRLTTPNFLSVIIGAVPRQLGNFTTSWRVAEHGDFAGDKNCKVFANDQRVYWRSELREGITHPPFASMIFDDLFKHDTVTCFNETKITFFNCLMVRWIPPFHVRLRHRLTGRTEGRGCAGTADLLEELVATKKNGPNPAWSFDKSSGEGILGRKVLGNGWYHRYLGNIRWSAKGSAVPNRMWCMENDHTLRDHSLIGKVQSCRKKNS